MAYYLTIILIVIFTLFWLWAIVSALITAPIGILGIILLACIIFIAAKLAHEKFTNKKDNYYDDHINK
jgi:hypothetical protein